MYPIYRDMKKEKLVSQCSDFRVYTYQDEWKKACKSKDKPSTCSLPEDNIEYIEKKSKIQEELCLKQNYPKKYGDL